MTREDRKSGSRIDVSFHSTETVEMERKVSRENYSDRLAGLEVKEM